MTAKNASRTEIPEFKAQMGKGRPKGTQNKLTKQVKEMILGALDDAGGQDYLARQADENPTAFLTLVGKVLPLQLTGENGGSIKVELCTKEQRDAAVAAAIRADS